MKLFRIAKAGHVGDLTGEGARLYGGRWNEKGVPAVYTSASLSLAALEQLVHLPLVLAPSDLHYLVLTVLDNVKITSIRASAQPESWDALPFREETIQIGGKWARAGKTLLLRVPSVIVPGEYNYLINPNHPDFKKIKVSRSRPFVFDERILERKK